MVYPLGGSTGIPNHLKCLYLFATITLRICFAHTHGESDAREIPSEHRYLYFCLFSSLELKNSFALSDNVNATSASFVVKQSSTSANALSDVDSHDEEGQSEQREAYFAAEIYNTN